jgi:hypothetical protein
MSVHCGTITTDPATKQVCLEVWIDSPNDNPVSVEFVVCQETVGAQKTVNPAATAANPDKICATYTSGPGNCVITATATDAGGGQCPRQLVLPV